jgi:hypothetical protein
MTHDSKKGRGKKTNISYFFPWQASSKIHVEEKSIRLLKQRIRQD